MAARNVLVTGSSGFIGSRLVPRLGMDHQLIPFSRSEGAAGVDHVQGRFDSFEDLRLLDGRDIDVLVHLAAETGGSPEEAALGVNVLGTRRLLRYLIDRGCRKFVLASSVAAVGCLDAGFVPLSIPIRDDHPCLARDAYGLSKAMVEELTRYFNRLVPDSDFIHFRIGGVLERYRPDLIRVDTPQLRPFIDLPYVAVEDVLRAFTAAVEAPPQPGVRVLNLVGPDSNAGDPVAKIVRAALGPKADGLNLARYDMPGCEFAPVYESDAIENELGFRPTHSVRLRRAGAR